MIIDGTRLVVTDNSGAKEVECIKTRGRYASIGDVITCSVKKAIRGKVTQVGRHASGGELEAAAGALLSRPVRLPCISNCAGRQCSPRKPPRLRVRALPPPPAACSMLQRLSPAARPPACSLMLHHARQPFNKLLRRRARWSRRWWWRPRSRCSARTAGAPGRWGICIGCCWRLAQLLGCRACRCARRCFRVEARAGSGPAMPGAQAGSAVQPPSTAGCGIALRMRPHRAAPRAPPPLAAWSSLTRTRACW